MGNSSSGLQVGKLISRNSLLSRGSMQGRWKNKTPQEVNINTFWNNIDNCGDSICGDVKRSKNLLDTYTKNLERYIETKYGNNTKGRLK